MKQKPKMLFIGHAYHLKTKSSRFMGELLETQYDIDYFYFNPMTDDEHVFDTLTGKSYDILVIWQLMPSLKRLKTKIQFNQSVYFPMYDQYVGMGGVANARWREYQQTKIICFSKTMADELKTSGFSVHYIQYFPKPSAIDSWGSEQKVFFWQRREDITINTVLFLLKNMDIQSVHIHKATDPDNRFFIPPPEWLDKTTYSVWFDTRDDMRKCIEESAFFIAPRLYEGIGMAFLEAMACGRCVIAPDLATANEYIIHGKTGYLYNPFSPQPIDIADVRQIQKNTYNYMCAGYEQWEREKFKIFNWIKEPVFFQKQFFQSGQKKIKQKRYKKTVIPGIRSRQTQNKHSFYCGKLPVWRIKENKNRSRQVHLLFGFIPILVIKKKGIDE